MQTTQTLGLYFKTKKEIALEYKLHPNTIATYFQRIGIHTRRRISPKLLEQFYEHYGRPE
ncbi:hypothetical protein [Flexithrix dorotheae]|uniref:hypothetical protein n=1 Tax=Flexithrix dorotheae TaxID=70993 RepID=UPI00039AF5B6|nr:hypothetical protein [Flexithrix dorotheae]